MADDDGDGDRDSLPSMTTEEHFHEVLRALVRTADANDIDVRGGWPVDGHAEEETFDVEITAVSRRTTERVEEDEFAAAAVVEAVKDRANVEVTALPPLYEAVGPDILEIIEGSNAESRQSVTFEYYGYTVTLEADGAIIVEE